MEFVVCHPKPIEMDDDLENYELKGGPLREVEINSE